VLFATHESMAISGWKTGQMAERSSQAAARKKVSARAGYKLDSIKKWVRYPAAGTKVQG
jgi:hypothetical protein